MHGVFTDRYARVPAGAPMPTGTTLTIIVDASTGQELDLQLSYASPDLASAGSVMAGGGAPEGEIRTVAVRLVS
jgi:hypothetical protein